MPADRNILLETLRQVWGYDQFRPQQFEIASSVLEGNDTVALLPTGGGKSICFQVPGLALGGVTLVISPLISLIQDQVRQLDQRGVGAIALSGDLSPSEFHQALDRVQNGHVQFLYTSPERALSRRFMERLPYLGITLLAIDEAHCVSQWGHDFRPVYQMLTKVRQVLADCACIALTASATPEVLEDLQSSLGLDKAKVFRASFDRPNLTIHLSKVSSRSHSLVSRLQSDNGRQIIYCRSRRQTEQWAGILESQGMAAWAYHAGLSAEDRAQRQSDWQKGIKPTMVATTAFGMGVDQPDVRQVFHVDWPESLEAYYQEIGRGGRDGKPSEAIMLMDSNTKGAFTRRVNQSKLSWEQAKEVYHCIAQSGSVPVGGGLDESQKLDFQDVMKRSGLSRAAVVNYLTIFERQGLMKLEERWKSRPTIHLKTQGRYMIEFAETNEDLRSVVYFISRQFEGVALAPVAVSLTAMSKKLGMPLHQLMRKLDRLHELGIVDFDADDHRHWIKWLHGRSPAGHLPLSKSELDRQEHSKAHRADSVVSFFQNSSNCRFSQLLSYFGERPVGPCGHCDHCLSKNGRSVQIVIEDIGKLLATKGPMSSDEIIQELPDAELEARHALNQGIHAQLWVVNELGNYIIV